MTDVGQTLAGSGTSGIFVQGTSAQINAELATLSYTAGATAVAAQISAQVYDQLGLSATAALPVSITAGAPLAGPTITGTPGNDNIVATVDHTTINSGDGERQHLSVGDRRCRHHRNGSNTVMGSVGGNVITTGSGNDDIRIGGSGSVVNAGLSVDTISDGGTGNTFVLPGSGGTDNVFGYVVHAATCSICARCSPGRAGTAQASLADFLKTTASPDGANTMLVVTPIGIATDHSLT